MTTKLRKIPMFGEGIASKSLFVTAQRRVNCYYEIRPDGDKSKVVVYGRPGLTLKHVFATVIRGMLATDEYLYVVAGKVLYQVSLDFSSITAFPNLLTQSGIVSMIFNNHQIIIVDGKAGYLFSVTNQTLTVITAAGFPNGCNTIAFLQSFFIAENPGTQNFFVSDSGDGSAWNALAFAGAAQYPDNILAVDSVTGLLVIFGSQHMEFWQNAGLIPQPFQYIANSANEYGLAAIASRVHVEDSIFFLSRTRQGGLQIQRLSGYTVETVSTSDVDNILAGMTTVSDAVGLSYQTDNHKFYQISFPSENRTLYYDLSTKVWYDAQTGISTSSTGRHIGNLSSAFNGQILISDYANGNLYRVDTASHTDNGTAMLREIISRHAVNNFNRFKVSQIYLDMETGSGTNEFPDAQVMLQISKDNGHTWGAERWTGLGMTGEYRTRAIWRRLGYCRDMVVKIRMTDAAPFLITSGAAVIAQRKAA